MNLFPAGQTGRLMGRIRADFRLDWHGIHGASHWARVMFHGLSLCQATGADAAVIRAFALLHDSQRHNDGEDPEHGSRAAQFARMLWQEGELSLSLTQMSLLEQACRGHCEGRTDAPLTVQVCWDADRLDLGRVCIRPDPYRLCTAAAKEPARIEQAWRWSRGGSAPDRGSICVPELELLGVMKPVIPA